jgi:hypothetical protein
MCSKEASVERHTVSPHLKNKKRRFDTTNGTTDVMSNSIRVVPQDCKNGR